MYDDSSWYTFVPTSAISGQKPGDRENGPDHKGRESLLQRPTEGIIADSQPIDDAAQLPVAIGPPEATVVRRAKSYSAFYDAAIAQLRKGKARPKSINEEKERPIEDDLAFNNWYDSIEDRLIEASEEEYERYYEDLQLTQSHIDNLITATASNLDSLDLLAKSFSAVEAQSTTFRARCEDLLSEQKQMEKVSRDLEENLQYYSYLEPISRRLNAPNAGNTVKSREFSEMLATLDHCLRYVQSHDDHLEAETYRSRYKLLMTRALTLIRNQFVSSLRDIATDVQGRIANRQLNDTTMSTLLYAKFRVGAPESKMIGKEIQKRAMMDEGADIGSEAEYQGLMNELYQAYSTARGKLVIPLARKRIGEIAIAPSTSKDLVSFARSATGYMRSVCMDEFELWGEWFEGYDTLYDFLESMCEPLYDHLRPRILRETQILGLCELCTLLQTKYLRDEDEDQEIVEPDQLDFSVLVNPIVEDAQTRLVFRAQTVLRNDIEKFKPKPEVIQSFIKDGATANGKTNGQVTSGRKLSKSSDPNTSIPQTSRVVDEAGDDVDKRDVQWGFDSEAAHKSWYPTLRKAIWLLSRIYRLVNSAVFDDLAHQIVHQTNMSLHAAASLIQSRTSSPTDAQLFLIRHLLLLKSQIVAFDIEFVTPEISFDFSGVTATFWELRERGGLFNPANLLRLVVGGGLIPQVVENMLDAKAELDGRLRKVINEFTEEHAKTMTASVSTAAAEKKGFDVHKANGALQAAIQTDAALLHRKLDAYLEDARTKQTLMVAVQDQVLQRYEEFLDELRRVGRRHNGFGSIAGGDDGKGKGKGREEASHGEGEGELMDVAAFADWVGAVCDTTFEGDGSRSTLQQEHSVSSTGRSGSVSVSRS